MKHIRQLVSQRKVVWANEIVVTTIKFAESCLKRDSRNPFGIRSKDQMKFYLAADNRKWNKYNLPRFGFFCICPSPCVLNNSDKTNLQIIVK
jgi:hypothetical protein